MFQIKIDNRERKLIESIEQQSLFPIIKENLDLGDIQFVHSEKQELLIVIERKTLTDLSTSIKDGRYKEQKNRLLHSIPGSVRKIYIFEGTNFQEFHLDKKIYHSVVVNSILRDNIHIYKTENVEDTLAFLQKIMKNLPEYVEEIQNPNYNQEIDLCGIQQIKKKNSNHETCFHNMLCGIPGVSIKISSLFVDEFKTIQQFMNYLLQELENDPEKIISFIENKKYGKNNRKIGKKIATKIWSFLCFHEKES